VWAAIRPGMASTSPGGAASIRQGGRRLASTAVREAGWCSGHDVAPAPGTRFQQHAAGKAGTQAGSLGTPPPPPPGCPPHDAPGISVMPLQSITTAAVDAPTSAPMAEILPSLMATSVAAVSLPAHSTRAWRSTRACSDPAPRRRCAMANPYDSRAVCSGPSPAIANGLSAIAPCTAICVIRSTSQRRTVLAPAIARHHLARPNA